VLRVGLYSNSGGRKKNTSWLAGAFLALAHICDRAACDKDGIRATKVGRLFDAMQHTLTFSSGCCPFLLSWYLRMSCSHDTSTCPRTPAATRPTRPAPLRSPPASGRPTCWSRLLLPPALP
jgi:hypothetical protein